jgi:hypothetical protein
MRMGLQVTRRDTHRLVRVCPPAAGKQTVAEKTRVRWRTSNSRKELPVSGLDVSGVLDDRPRKLGEGVAESCHALRLHFEATLLRHGSIPAGGGSV